MSCRCVAEKYMRDRAHQRELAKKVAVFTGKTQVLYRRADGQYRFVDEGTAYNGTIDEIVTPY